MTNKKEEGMAAMEAEILEGGKAVIGRGEINMKSPSYNQERIPARLLPKFYAYVELMIKEGRGDSIDQDELQMYKQIFSPYAEIS